MLDEILGSLPVGPPSSQEDARKRSADSPASAKVPDTDLDDAILLWENDSSPLFSHTAERTRQSQALPNANHPFVASPGEKSYKLSGSFSMDTQTLSADKENTAPLLPKDGTPVRMKEAPARIHDSRKEGIVCASTYTVLKSAAVHVASSGGRGVLTPQSGKSGRDDVNASPAATTSQEGCGEMGESFSFGSSSPFQDTIVPRASKVRSPPVASSRSAEQATGQVSGTLSPRRDSYRFSASFVLDSQTVKAMEGITIQAADVHDTPDVSNVVTKNGAADDTLPKSPLRESHSSEISLGACSLGASTLSELFSSPGSEARQLDRSDPGSERSTRSSKSSGSRKRSASDGELFPSTDDSDLSADSLADQVREAFAWEQVRSVDEFIRRWAKHKEFAMALAVAKHVERETSIGLRRSARLQTKPRESPFVTDGKCLKGIAVCWENYRAHFLPLESLAASSLESLSHCLKGAKQVVVPDVPLALRFLARPCGLDLARLGWEEPRTAHWLLDPNRGEAELSEMVDQWAPYLEPLFEGDGQLVEAAAREAVLVWNLQKPLVAALKKADLYTLYVEQELRMLGMLCKMDLNGFGYDPERAQQTMADAERALDALQTDAWALAGRRFTLSSCQQVSIVLKAQVVPLAKGSLPPGGLWTKPVLERLSALHPLPAKILDWRKLNCVLTKILRPLGSHRRRHGDSGGALPRIHPWSRPWSTTGRAALTNPNLQGMAKGFVVCTQPPVTIAARAAFRAPPGWVLLSVDYSQVELRLLAHLSEDERLCGAFRAGGDVFRRMAALWSHCAEDAVDNTLRQRTKQICYGITYGQGSQSLANELGVERSEADAMIAQFWQAFPGLHRYSKRVLEQARASGEVRTLLGRRRPLPDLRSKRDAERGRAERQVLNTTVQGSAADLLRRSLLALDDSLGREFPESRGLLQPDRPHKGGAHLVLQLHDEILLEVWERDLPPVAALVRQCMEGAVPLRVPLAVRLHAGPDWARLQELTDLH
ncbi:DNA polymerase theta-like [Haemaphysalis longicornis]